MSDTGAPPSDASGANQVGWQGELPDEVAAVQDVDDGEQDARLHPDARRLLVSLVRPHQKAIAAVLVLVVIQVAAALAAPWLIAVAIDTSLPDAIRGDYTSLAVVVATLAGTALLSGLLRAAFVHRSGVIGQKVLFDLRRRAFDHAQALSVSFHERFTSGWVIARLTSDVDTLTELLDAGLDGLINAALQIVVIGVVLLILDVPLGLIALASLVPVWLLCRWYLARAPVAFRSTRETVATLIVEIVEAFNGIRAVQAFRREPRNDALFDELNQKYRAANTRTFRLEAIFVPGTSLPGGVAAMVVLLVGGYRVIDGGLQLGVLTAFLLYLRQFYDPLQDVAMFTNSLQSATAALEKISAVLAEAPAVPEPEHPVAPAASTTQGQVQLDRVTFGYRADRPVLPHLDLVIPAGQTVALVGETGAGKSTIAKLIARFYDPIAGSVSLDGVDLRELSTADLHECIVMITQEGFLFSGSVADNIAFGRVGATREQVVTAAREVGADEFITRLPEGYDTDVRKRGGRLSAGQRQLLAFARALLAEPAVLVLDEATSSLDVPTERAVQRAMHRVLADRTALIIAHRLSTVEIADRVLVLDAGRVVEDGTPEELISGVGRFADLHRAWRESLV